MANIGSLTALLGLDNKQFLAGAAQSQASLLGLSKSLSGLAVPVLAIGGTIALAKGISRATDAAAKLQKSMATVATLVDKPKEEIEDLTAEVQAMTTEVLKSSEDLSSGLYQVFSAGITDSAEALNVLRASAIAATAGISDTRTSVDAITTILNAYKLEARDATRVSDLLFQTVRLGKTTYDQLAGSIGTVTSIAATMGVELEDLFAIIATATKGGIETRRATTGLRATLLAIIKPADSAIQKAKELGLEWNSAAVRAKGLVGFLNEMRVATGGSDEAINELIPNARALSVVMALVGKQNDELNRIMGEFEDASGSSAEAFKKQADTVEAQSERMSLAIERLRENIGKTFLGPKKAVVSFLADFFEKRNKGIEELKKARAKADPLFEQRKLSIGDIGTGLSLLIKLAGTGALLETSTQKIAENISQLNIGTKKTKEEMAGVLNNFDLLETKIPGIAEQLTKSFEKFPSIFGVVSDSIIKETKKTGDQVIKTWSETADSIKRAFEDLGIVPKAEFDDVIKSTIRSFETVTKELGKRGEINVQTATKIRQKLIEKLKGISAEAAKSGFIIDEEQIKIIEESLSRLGDSTLRTAQEVTKQINNETGTLEVNIKQGAFEVNKFIANTAKEAINSFKDVGLDVTALLKDDFSVLADSHVQKWTFTTDQLQNLDISYTDSFLSELNKREDSFAKFARAIEREAERVRKSIEESSSFPGQTTSITIPAPRSPLAGLNVPISHKGVLSAPRTELNLIKKGELIVPAEQNPFNDNRVFNNTFNIRSNQDEFEQRQELQRLIDQNRERISI